MIFLFWARTAEGLQRSDGGEVMTKMSEQSGDALDMCNRGVS